MPLNSWAKVHDLLEIEAITGTAPLGRKVDNGNVGRIIRLE